MSVADRLYRRVMMMVANVKITATDDTGPIHKAQIRGFPPETIDNMPVMQIYGLATHAMPGSDAMAIFGSGDRSKGVIVATGNQQYRLRNLQPGEVALYTDEGVVVKLARNKIVEITGCDKLNITAATEMTITAPTLTVTAKTEVFLDTPLLRVSGAIETQNGNSVTSSGSFLATGEITAKVGAGQVSLSTHRHPAINAPPTPGTELE